MSRRALFLAAALALPLLPGVPALAQQPPMPPQGGMPGQAQSAGDAAQQEVASCIGSDQNNPSKIRGCLDSERSKLAPQLTQLTQSYRATLPPPRQAEFDRLQGAWSTYRDLQCAFAGTDPSSGQMGGAAQSGCLLEMTVDRIDLMHAVMSAGQQAPQR